MWKDSKEAICEIESRRHHHAGLEALRKAMNRLDDPQDDVVSLHVGGTNGKGSTVNYIRSILNEAGYKVGTFTSPYLVSHHDRIRIDNVNISDERLYAYIQKTEKLWRDYELSMFEIDMMIASLYFKEEQVDFAIYEVGMGGRLDATNILSKPIVCAISNIGLDHTQFLGDTYEKIAYEKAGIIKEGMVCFGGSRRQDCQDVLKRVCEEKQGCYYPIGKISDIEVKEGISFVYKNKKYKLNTLALYQCENAGLAIEVVSYLKKQGYLIEDQHIQAGLMNTQWLGRFEVVRKDPLVIIDGAHNVDGIKALVQSMKRFDHIHIIFSCLSDKNGGKMIEKLLEISDDITICEFENDRADKASSFVDYPVHIEKDYKKAIDEKLKEEGVLLISGSLYFISLVRDYLI